MTEPAGADRKPEPDDDAKAKDRAAAYARWTDSEQLGGELISPPIPASPEANAPQ